MDIILERLKEIKESDDENDNPDTDDLLDPEDGYYKQTFVQNLGDGEIMCWEGWSDYCWDGIYGQERYKGLSKEEVLEQFLSIRFPIIAKECDLTIIKSGYDWYESWRDGVDDGYITFVRMKIN